MSTTIKKYECDLHCHTTRSDGNDSPAELVDKAVKTGLKAIGVVDHDISPEKDWPELKNYARSKGLEVVFGYEFSCDTDVDDVHIIGYEMDWENPMIVEEENRAKNSKVTAYRKLCSVLSNEGMKIDFAEDILKYRNGQGDVCKREPELVQKKHIFEALAMKGYFPSWEKAKLFVRDNPDFSIKREKINPLKALNLIKTCNGLSVLAHPYLIDEKVSSGALKSIIRHDYISELIEYGLDGIEATYTYDKTTYKGSMTKKEIEQEVITLYGGRVKFFTGGSDYHNDAKKGAPNPRYLGEAGISFKQFSGIFIT